MRVAQLWRYPVKSLQGELLDAVAVTDVGLAGDRAWGIHHAETGTVLTARRAPELLFASARLVAPDEVVVTLPDGTETNDDAVLSAWLGRDVTLVRPGDDGATYENPMDVENDADWIHWQGPAGSFHDSTRAVITIVGSDTFGNWDVRRFRPNVVIDGGGEDELVGTRRSLGSAEIDIRKQIDRCVMVTRPQPGLDRDLGVLKTIVATRGNHLSVGAMVVAEGRVGLGDRLT